MSGFSTDQVFKSREELMEWVRNTGRSLGYAIVTKRSKAKNGYVSKVVLMCDRGGVYKSDKDSSRETGTRKINCPFEMVGKFSKKNGSWTLKVKPGEHNHPPGEYMEGHPILKRLTPNEHQLVAELTGKGVFPKDILGVMKERDENNVSTIKNIYNARDKIRATDHKGKSLMEVLMSHLNDKGYTFEISTNRVSNKLEDLFFVPKISYKYFLDFPHVLLMDVTYNTNKYKLPFLEIVGVTSTNKTISIAFAVMRKETEEKYLWALNCLKSTLDERSMQQPRVIVTDRELALMNACEKVFPNATRLLCRWHVSQSVFRNCKSFFTTDHDWKIFNIMWNALVESQTWTSFLQNYKQLQAMLIHHQDVLDYLNSTWLNKYKEMFVSVWTNECLHFGNQTTNRAESQHAKLKKFLNSANCTLDKIVRHIDEVVNSQYTIVKDSFEKSRTVLMHKHNLPMLKLLHGSVSHEALDIIIAERHLKRSHCRCQVRKCYGLPCACEISKYKKAGQSIPLDSVDEFWRKLELPVYCEDITCDVELESFKQAFDNRSKPGKKSLLQKLKALTNPSIPFVEEPDVKKNTRGRPTTKSKQQTIPNPAIAKPPLQRSYSQKPPRHSPFGNSQDHDYTQEPWRHSSFGYLETDDYVGYISPDVNYQVPGETSPFINQDIYGKKPFKDDPGEPSPFMTQDTDGQGFFTNLLNTPGYDFMGLNQDIVGQSSFANSTSAPGYDFMGLNQDQASQVIHNYIHLIPKIFHAYVTRIHNVLGDGNCGFRATASALGYGEDEWLFIRRSLMEELLEFRNKYTKAFLGSFKDVFTSLAWSGSGFAPEKHWMIMPEAGFLIANKFNVIVHFLSQEKRNSSTCFSLWRGPHEFPEKKIITIAHVNGNHFIMVELQGEYPIASTNNLWKLMRENDAAGWENIFESRQNMYKSWIAQPATFGGCID